MNRSTPATAGRWFRISETQLTALRQGHTHVSGFDKKNILMTVWDDQMMESRPTPALTIVDRELCKICQDGLKEHDAQQHRCHICGAEMSHMNNEICKNFHVQKPHTSTPAPTRDLLLTYPHGYIYAGEISAIGKLLNAGLTESVENILVVVESRKDNEHDAAIRAEATAAENKRILDAIEKFKTEAWARNDPCDGGFSKFYQSLRSHP